MKMQKNLRKAISSILAAAMITGAAAMPVHAEDPSGGTLTSLNIVEGGVSTNHEYASSMKPTTANIRIDRATSIVYPSQPVMIYNQDGTIAGQVNFYPGGGYTDSAYPADAVINWYNVPAATKDEEGVIHGMKTQPFTFEVMYKDAAILADGTTADLKMTLVSTAEHFRENGITEVKPVNSIFMYNSAKLEGQSANMIWYASSDATGLHTDAKFQVVRNGEHVRESTKIVIYDLDTMGFNPYAGLFGETPATKWIPGYTYNKDGSTEGRNGKAGGNGTAEAPYVSKYGDLATNRYRLRTYSPHLAFLYSEEITDSNGLKGDYEWNNTGIQFWERTVTLDEETGKYNYGPWKVVSEGNNGVDFPNAYPEYMDHKIMGKNYSPNALYAESIKLEKGVISDVYIPGDNTLSISENGTKFSGTTQTNTGNGYNRYVEDKLPNMYFETKSGITTIVDTEEFELAWEGFGCGTGIGFGELTNKIRATTSGIYPNGGEITTQVYGPDGEYVDINTNNNEGKTNQSLVNAEQGHTVSYIITPEPGFVVDKIYIEEMYQTGDGYEWRKSEITPVKQEDGTYLVEFTDVQTDYHLDATFRKDPELGITKNASVEKAEIGDEITYTIEVTNSGDVDAKDTVVTDVLPDYLEYVSSQPAVQSQEGNTLTWKVNVAAPSGIPANENRTETTTEPSAEEPLGPEYNYDDDYAGLDESKITRPGEPTTITVVCKVTSGAADTLTNTAEATHPDMTNEEPPTDDSTVEILKPELTIEKTADVSTGVSGDTVTYTIKVTNTGEGKATDAVVTDDLPANLTVVSTSPVATSSTNKLEWTGLKLQAGESKEFTVLATINRDTDAAAINNVTAHDPDQTNPEDPTDDEVVTITQTRTVTRTIEYHYLTADGETAAETVEQTMTFTRTGNEDGTWPDWEPQSFDSVDSPEIEGWTSDQDTVDGLEITPDSQVANEIVIYQPENPVADPDETYGGINEPQTGVPEFEVTTPTTPDGSENIIETIKLVDPETGETTDETTITIEGEGTYTLNEDGTISFTPEDGYTGDPTPITVEGTDSNGNTVTTTYTPHVIDNKREATVSRTIEYRYLTADGERVTEDVVQERSYVRYGVVDPTTGEIISLPPWEPQSVEDVTSPFVEGWTPDQDLVNGNEAATPDNFPADVVVIYQPNKPEGTPETSYGPKGDPQTKTVTFEVKTPTTPDGSENKIEKIELVDEDGNPTDSVTVEGGTYTIEEGGKITFTPNEDFVGDPTPVVVRGTDSNGQTGETTYTPHVVDNEQTTTVTRTIEYKYEDGSKAKDPVTQTETFTRTGTVDPETGKVTWNEWTEKDLEEVPTDKIDGYTHDRSKIDQVTVTGDSSDMHEVVVYKKIVEPKKEEPKKEEPKSGTTPKPGTGTPTGTKPSNSGTTSLKATSEPYTRGVNSPKTGYDSIAGVVVAFLASLAGAGVLIDIKRRKAK